MRRTALVGVAIGAIAVMMSGCSEPVDPKGGSGGAVGTGGAGANLDDDEFVRDVALKHLAEVELSRLALQKATNPDVKAFAQMMIDDHAGAGQQLKSIMSGQPIQWPTQLDEKRRRAADDLAKEQGAEFEKAYLDAMVEGHQDLAAKLESRLDVQSLADWKTAAAGRTDSKALPDPNVAMRDVQIRPNKSDKDATAKINQWAAETYPLTQKHLDTARTLKTAAKKRSTS